MVDLYTCKSKNAPFCQQISEMASEKEKQEPSRELEEDVISRSIGNFGKWQLTFTFLLSLFNLPCTWHIYALTFQGRDVDFWCAPPSNLETLSTDIWRNISQPRSGNSVSTFIILFIVNVVHLEEQNQACL